MKHRHHANSLVLLAPVLLGAFLVACGGGDSAESATPGGGGTAGTSSGGVAGTGGAGGGPGGAAGTGGTGGKANPPKPEDLPEFVDVPAAAVEVGTVTLNTSYYAKVAAFQVTRYPVTVKQYRACVEAGACTPPGVDTAICKNLKLPADAKLDGPTYLYPGADQLPVGCMLSKQAKEYCAWIGARMPRPAEWYLGARGPVKKMYPWSPTPNSCDLHPRIGGGGTLPCCLGAKCDWQNLLAVGKHPLGKGSGYFEDMLLSRDELVGPSLASDPQGEAFAGAGGVVSELSVALVGDLSESPDGGLSPTFRCAR